MILLLYLKSLRAWAKGVRIEEKGSAREKTTKGRGKATAFLPFHWFPPSLLGLVPRTSNK